MADQPRQTLCDLIQRFGADVATDPKRCEALLKDLLLNGFKREINALVSAAREGVPSELRQPTGGTPLPAVVVQQARKLHEDLGLDQSLAEWAVKTWAVALGVKLTVANPPAAKTPAPVPKVFTPVPKTPTEPPASFQWVLTQTGEIAPAPKTPAWLPPRAAIPTSPSGFDLAKRLRDQQARQQQERDEANLAIAEARRLVDEEQDIPGAEQLLLSLPEGLRNNDLLAEVHRMRDELAKQQARQERNRVILATDEDSELPDLLCAERRGKRCHRVCDVHRCFRGIDHAIVRHDMAPPNLDDPVAEAVDLCCCHRPVVASRRSAGRWATRRGDPCSRSTSVT